MERGKSKGFARVISDLVAMFAAATREGGNTKAIDAITERSESWQQDTAQAIIPGISCPQFM
jgi:hypothetical protein